MLEAWINPTGVSYPANRYPIFEWNDNDPTVPPNSNPPHYPPWGVQLWISEQQPDGQIIGGAGYSLLISWMLTMVINSPQYLSLRNGPNRSESMAARSCHLRSYFWHG